MEEQEETFWGPPAAEYEIKLGTVLQTVVEIWNNKEFDSLWKKIRAIELVITNSKASSRTSFHHNPKTVYSFASI